MTAPGARNIGLPLMNLVRLKGVPILQQLHLEERLLRKSSDNWCIINDGTHDPTIVMGISGKPVELLEIDPVLQDEIPVIQRFTGGGTVIVDQGTVFVTFICNKDAVPGLQSYPRPIMSWSSLVYQKVFQGIGDFSLRENDYVLGNHKFGGNAQSIIKNRWLHHTSFLWDYEISNMRYLKLPKRTPEYRQARGHLEFICRMKDYIPRSNFIDRTIDAVGNHFLVRSMELEAIKYPSGTKFQPSSRLLRKQELEEAEFDSRTGVFINGLLRSLDLCSLVNREYGIYNLSNFGHGWNVLRVNEQNQHVAPRVGGGTSLIKLGYDSLASAVGSEALTIIPRPLLAL